MRRKLRKSVESILEGNYLLVSKAPPLLTDRSINRIYCNLCLFGLVFIQVDAVKGDRSVGVKSSQIGEI